MKFSELFQDKYTVVFVLILVLLVSVWISRTYRNGGFGSWMAPSDGYGSGVIEGLVTSTPLWVGEAYTYSTNPPITSGVTGGQATAAADGVLILNRVNRVSNTDATFRFIFKHSTASPPGADRKLKITIPQSHIATPAAGDLTVTLKPTASGLTTAAAAAVASLSGTNTDTATGASNIAVSTPAATTNVVIEFTLQRTTAIAANTMYALELSGLKWKTLSATLTPNTAVDTLVTLESTMETVPRLVAINLHSTTAGKIVKIFKDTTYDFESTYADYRKIITTPLAQLVEPTADDGSNTASTTGAETTFKLEFMLTNPYSPGDELRIQLRNVSKLGPTISIKIKQGDRTEVSGISTFTEVPGGNPYAKFVLAGSATAIGANISSMLIINGLRTPDVASNESSGMKIRTFSSTTVGGGAAYGFDSANFLDKGEYTFPAILARPNTAVSTGSPSSSGTASDGSTYVTSAASSVLISDVKRQMNWAVGAQKEYESAYKVLRSATTETAKTDAQLKYDVAVARRNRLIASHPDSWYDGANWRYGDDGHVRKCTEPSTLSSNEGNCQNIYKMDISGNLVKSADGNNILLMRKCPWKCNNPGQTGSDSCRIDADCLKVTRWATYLPDGTQIEKNLLATTRSQYDDIASETSSSALGEDDIYKRGITRNFRGYGRGRPGQGQGQGQSPGLFGSIRDATGSIIRGIGNWIDPNDPAGNQRTAKHNAYYYEDGSPAATAYLGMYNGQGYEEESPFYGESKPMNYYYTTNYYYTDGEASGGGGGGANDGKSNMPGKLSKVMPFEQSINL